MNAKRCKLVHLRWNTQLTPSHKVSKGRREGRTGASSTSTEDGFCGSGLQVSFQVESTHAHPHNGNEARKEFDFWCLGLRKTNRFTTRKLKISSVSNSSRNTGFQVAVPHKPARTQRRFM